MADKVGTILRHLGMLLPKATSGYVFPMDQQGEVFRSSRSKDKLIGWEVTQCCCGTTLSVAKRQISWGLQEGIRAPTWEQAPNSDVHGLGRPKRPGISGLECVECWWRLLLSQSLP